MMMPTCSFPTVQMQPTNSRQPNIVVIAEDPDVSYLLHDLCEREGYAVSSCAYTSHCLEKLPLAEYDIAILDVRLYDGTGFSVLTKLVMAKEALLTLVLTTSQKDEDRVREMTGNAAACVRRPYDNRRIREDLRELACSIGTTSLSSDRTRLGT